MEWRLDESTDTLEVFFIEGPAPSRDEVAAFLEQFELLTGGAGVRALLINGRRVRGGPLAHAEVVGMIGYETARWRTLGRIAS